MKIQVKESTVVQPAKPTPRRSLWISNLDSMLPNNYHTLLVYFFRFNGTPNFFDSMVLKAALSRALFHFYPVAGRLKLNGNRIEIDCNGEGVMFIDAESDGRLDELDEFSPKPDLSFASTVDYSQGISTFPLFLVQVTRFKCGGVGLGVANEHHTSDGISVLHFINTWSNIARGMDITIPPFFDRQAVLSARNPPQPKFNHIEYQPPPAMKIPQNNDSISVVYKRFTLTSDQICALKAKCVGQRNGVANYTRFEVVAGHAWRCITKARGLPEDQLTKLYITVDGRSRLRPPPPQGYFGNVLLTATPIAMAGELLLKPLEFSVSKVHDAIAQINHDYIMSALDYLELQRDLSSMARGRHTYKCPNMGVVAWTNKPFYDEDFGWGKPVYVGQGGVQYEGKTYVMASPVNDGSLWYAVALPDDVMPRFEKAFYEDVNDCNKRCESKI